MTVIDFEGFVDGVAFDGGKGENYPLTPAYQIQILHWQIHRLPSEALSL